MSRLSIVRVSSVGLATAFLPLELEGSAEHPVFFFQQESESISHEPDRKTFPPPLLHWRGSFCGLRFFLKESFFVAPDPSFFLSLKRSPFPLMEAIGSDADDFSFSAMRNETKYSSACRTARIFSSLLFFPFFTDRNALAGLFFGAGRGRPIFPPLYAARFLPPPCDRLALFLIRPGGAGSARAFSFL